MKKEMKWIKLSPDAIPEREVLVANFKKGTYGYKEKVIGYLTFDEEKFSCQGDGLLEECTHYIDLSDFDIE